MIIDSFTISAIVLCLVLAVTIVRLISKDPSA
jgi:hypothetical protein